MRLREIALGFGLLAAVGLAVACGDDGDDAGVVPTSTPPATSPTSEPESSPTPTAGQTPGTGFPTGIDSVDAIANAVSAGGTAAPLADLVLFRQVACEVPSGQGAGGPPPCREGEAAGTEVLVVLAASCEGFYAREDELQLQSIMLADPPLFGAFHISDGSQVATIWTDARYAVVLNRLGGGTGSQLAFTLFADDEGIVGYSAGCGETPEQYVELQGLTDAIIAPAE
jgi:hypothetical protein